MSLIHRTRQVRVEITKKLKFCQIDLEVCPRLRSNSDATTRHVHSSAYPLQSECPSLCCWELWAEYLGLGQRRSNSVLSINNHHSILVVLLENPVFFAACLAPTGAIKSIMRITFHPSTNCILRYPHRECFTPARVRTCSMISSSESTQDNLCRVMRFHRYKPHL